MDRARRPGEGDIRLPQVEFLATVSRRRWELNKDDPGQADETDDEVDVIESKPPTPDEVPAGVPRQPRVTKSQLVIVAVVVGSVTLLALTRVWVASSERSNAAEQCTKQVESIADYVKQGMLDYAEQFASNVEPKCKSTNAAELAEVRRKIAAARADVKVKADREAKKDAAESEREAVRSFPADAIEMRKNFKEAAVYLARGNLEKAAPLIGPCQSTLMSSRGTSVEATADWIALDEQCKQLSAKVQPYVDQEAAKLAEAGRQVLAEVAQDRRDGVKYTREGHLAARTVEKLELARQYAAANDEKGFALLIQNDDEIILLKPLMKVNVIDRSLATRPFVKIHFRGTTLDLWTTTDALQDP